MEGRVLLVDDDKELLETMASALPSRGFTVSTRPSAEAALASLGEDDWDAIVTDISMSGMSGLAFCERVVQSHPHLPVVLMTAFSSMETAVAAVRAGAYDFVGKPFELNVLALALDRAVRNHRLRHEVRMLREVVARSSEMEGMLGNSPAIRQVFELIDRAAQTDASVLISGKSGTGKELVARALHKRGRRAANPFVAVNCAAIPESLLESELFGHVKGAFTDARTQRRGLFLKAHGGTIFLDEIGELPHGMQSKLLRVLQDRTVRAVGADQEEAFDARLVFATNRDLEVEVERGRFREDLFYRINVIRIDLPPLQSRGHDILHLAQSFLVRAAAQLQKPIKGFSPAVAEKLLSYGWPGNVRELENCIERAVAFARADQIGVDDLPERVRDYKSSDLTIPGLDGAEMLSMEEVERRHIMRVLKAVNGSKAAAAGVLGLHPSTLYRKLEQYGKPDRTPR